MIPETIQNISTVSISKQKTKTYYMKEGKNEIRGDIDGLEAMEQAIYKILHTKRYKHLIYNWDYGVEIDDLFGKNYSYVVPELERRIREALLTDDRITAVENFQFYPNKNELLVTFTVTTDYGVIEAERTVDIDV